MVRKSAPCVIRELENNYTFRNCVVKIHMTNSPFTATLAYPYVARNYIINIHVLLEGFEPTLTRT